MRAPLALNASGYGEHPCAQSTPSPGLQHGPSPLRQPSCPRRGGRPVCSTHALARNAEQASALATGHHAHGMGSNLRASTQLVGHRASDTGNPMVPQRVTRVLAAEAKIAAAKAAFTAAQQIATGRRTTPRKPRSHRYRSCGKGVRRSPCATKIHCAIAAGSRNLLGSKDNSRKIWSLPPFPTHSSSSKTATKKNTVRIY